MDLFSLGDFYDIHQFDAARSIIDLRQGLGGGGRKECEECICQADFKNDYTAF
jgi:hypothetical protein